MPHNDPWIGKRIVTRVPDSNEVTRGDIWTPSRTVLVEIPVGWMGTVDRIVHYDDGEAMYAVAWEDDANAPAGEGNMGWTIWSASELRDEAEVIDAA
jgi:hypothetical protein